MNFWWKFGLFLASYLFAFGLGVYGHHLYVGNAEKSAAVVAEHKAAEGSTKIIHDTQIITKVIHDTKDTCVGKPIPADLAHSLR